MRCFLAAEVPEAVSAKLHALQSEAKKIGLHASFPKETHLTLCFFAEITEKQAEDKIRALQNMPLPKASAEISGTGFFPNAEHPRVFWAGVKSPQLVELQRKAADSIDYHDERTFNPHITLARIKSGKNFLQLRDLQLKHANDVFGSFTIEKLFFKQSVLSSEGAIHTTLAEIPLV